MKETMTPRPVSHYNVKFYFIMFWFSIPLLLHWLLLRNRGDGGTHELPK